MTNLPIELISTYMSVRKSNSIRKSVFELPKEFKMFTWKASLADHYENVNADFVYYYEKFVDFESTFYANRITPPLTYIVEEEDWGEHKEVKSPISELAKFFVFIQELIHRNNFRVNLVCSSHSKVPNAEKEAFRNSSRGLMEYQSLIASSVMPQILSWFEAFLREPPYTDEILNTRRRNLLENAFDISNKVLENAAISRVKLEQIKEFAGIDSIYLEIDSFRNSN